ncbi:hypothetical protein EXIGLDRAFT_134006 [Exidia glandulosa HHB12029]|uniref:Uncharacterized protein n=1 Tax=Exidia glandulosa HHB12029 TaxID=1314781 RepID=A0A165NFP1_EXIGL|nr:hypothetical protein EXIGLDRAFT_134006 [Exidia glandulosa HHB12029]
MFGLLAHPRLLAGRASTIPAPLHPAAVHPHRLSSAISSSHLSSSALTNIASVLLNAHTAAHCSARLQTILTVWTLEYRGDLRRRFHCKFPVAPTTLTVDVLPTWPLPLETTLTSRETPALNSPMPRKLRRIVLPPIPDEIAVQIVNQDRCILFPGVWLALRSTMTATRDSRALRRSDPSLHLVTAVLSCKLCGKVEELTHVTGTLLYAHTPPGVCVAVLPLPGFDASMSSASRRILSHPNQRRLHP